MIMVGKVFIALIWSFWLISSGSIANGAKTLLMTIVRCLWKKDGQYKRVGS